MVGSVVYFLIKFKRSSFHDLVEISNYYLILQVSLSGLNYTGDSFKYIYFHKT